MNAEVAKRWEKVEKCREEFIEKVKGLDGPTRILRPEKGCLSPAEVVKHFALTEGMNLHMMTKHPPSTLKKKKVHHGPMWNSMLKSMQNPVKPVPTLPQLFPKGTVDIDAAAKEWERTRHAMIPYFAECEGLESPMLKHMILVGLLSCSDYLDLLEAHMNYHTARLTSG